MSFKDSFSQAFLQKDRWQLLLKGFGNTIIITLAAAVLGIIIGIVAGAVRAAYDKNIERMRRRKNASYYILSFFNFIFKIYITIIRGTPTVVQLLICYFMIFSSWRNGIPVAMFAFGLNSGAYVAEIIRGGIMSIDEGQFEAGRSLGFNYTQTMRYIIVPQVIKDVLPALMNEFITLFKETSIAGYVGIRDLTKAGDIIRATTLQVYLPLLIVAAMYLIIVLLMTYIEGKVERRLRANER
jgi:ABC-type amino acid transport system permease subunit